MQPETPPGTRLILASESLLDFWGTRTDDGRLLVMEWGERQPGGWYEPVIRTVDDGKVVISRVEYDRLRVGLGDDHAA